MPVNAPPRHQRLGKPDDRGLTRAGQNDAELPTRQWERALG